MAKKFHYYVLVFSSNGPVYVTSVNRRNECSFWDKDKAPLELNMYEAEDIAFGLCINGHSAVVVKSYREIDCQPYRYDTFEIKFVEREEKEE